jgi:hypothetical protein
MKITKQRLTQITGGSKMKITKQQLTQIINEEIKAVLEEGIFDRIPKVKFTTTAKKKAAARALGKQKGAAAAQDRATAAKIAKIKPEHTKWYEKKYDDLDVNGPPGGYSDLDAATMIRFTDHWGEELGDAMEAYLRSQGIELDYRYV